MEELRRSVGAVCVSETVYDGQAEQGVELDYVLPDYYPEIFRILCCRLTPRIMAYSLVGDSKLMIDGNVDIRVMYLAEDSNAVHCIEQRYTYSKTVDIGKTAAGGDIRVKLSSRADYCNCRAVSGRRIDVRGAISTKIHITSVRSVALPVMPADIQIKSAELLCCGNIVSADKQFTVREEIETGASGICCIMRTNAVPKVNEVRIIADKAVIKGQVTVSAAYGIYKEGEQGCNEIERMTADIPVSQIIELTGIDEEHSYTVDIDVLNCELGCSNENGIITCNMLAVCRISCCKETVVSVPVDVFSTEFETEHTMKQLRAVKSCNDLSRQFTQKAVLASDGNHIDAVWDCSAEVYNVSCTPADDDSLKISGVIGYQAMCRNSDGVPCWLEKQESFEQIVSVERTTKDSAMDISVVCIDTDHSIRPDGTVELTAMTEVSGVITDTEVVAVTDNVTIHEDRPRKLDCGYALRICYADGNESSWDIAKRYGTSVEAILSENDIADRDEALTGMVLIPTV